MSDRRRAAVSVMNRVESDVAVVDDEEETAECLWAALLGPSHKHLRHFLIRHPSHLLPRASLGLAPPPSKSSDFNSEALNFRISGQHPIESLFLHSLLAVNRPWIS